MPAGALGKFSENGLSFNGAVAYQAADFLAVGLELGWLRTEFASTRLGDETLDSDVVRHVLHLGPFFKVGRQIETAGIRWKPYGLFGLGAYIDRTDAGTLTVRSTGDRFDTEAEGWRGHFGLSFGAGAELPLGERLSVAGEVRYHQYQGSTDVDGDGSNDLIQFVVPGARLSYRF